MNRRNFIRNVFAAAAISTLPVVATEPTNVLFIHTNGKVGLGVTCPSSVLYVEDLKKVNEFVDCCNKEGYGLL